MIGWRVPLFAAALAVAWCPAQAQSTPETPLKVATRILPPFVIRENDKLSGFSIELWTSLAHDINRPFEFVVKDRLPDLLDEVRSRRADLAIAAISITADRQIAFDFSQPMFEAGLQVMILDNGTRSPSGLRSFFGGLASPAFLQLLALLAALMVLPVPIIWLLERTRPGGVAQARTIAGQLFSALWWSSSTLAGQATHMPRTAPGRVFAVLWMFIGVVVVSYFTATVTANLTVKQLGQSIASPRDLPGKRVATVTGSTAAAYLNRNDIQPIEFDRIEQAYAALETASVDAIVYDAPTLLYHAAHGGKGKVRTVGSIFQPEAYGILFPESSPLRRLVDPALLRMRESGEYQTLYRKWFAAEPNDGS